MTFSSGSNHSSQRKYRHPKGEEYDVMSSSVGMESFDSRDERQSNPFESISNVGFQDDERNKSNVWPQNQYESSLNRMSIGSNKSIRSTKSHSKPTSMKRLESLYADISGKHEENNRVRQAEIENVILKQILRSTSRVYEEDEDDGHLSVATGAISVMSTYTTKEILGDLTDHEDAKSVRQGRSLSKSVARMRSSSTTSRRQSNDRDYSDRTKTKTRSKSVVSRRVRLKDKTERKSMDDSSQLYASFMKNMPREETLHQKSEPMKETKLSSATEQWDPFEKSIDESFGQDSTSVHEFTSPSANIAKPSLRRISSAPISKHIRGPPVKKSFMKPSLGRHSSVPEEMNFFTNSTNFFASQASNSPSKAGKLANYGQEASFFRKDSPKEPISESFNNIGPVTVFTFNDEERSIKKVREKQFMEERMITQLSPVRPKCNQTTSPNSFVPKVTTEKVNSIAEEWESFGDRHSHSNLVELASSESRPLSNNSMVSKLEQSKKSAAWAVIPNETKSSDSSSHRKSDSGSSFESFPNPSWGDDGFQDFQDQRPTSSMEEFDGNDDGFLIIEGPKKIRKNVTNKSRDQVLQQVDKCFNSPIMKSSKHFHKYISQQMPKNDTSSWNEWGEDKLPDSFEESEISKLSSSTISFRGSPSTMSSPLEFSKCDNSGTTLPTVSSTRSTPTVSSDELSQSNRFKTSVINFKASPSDTDSQFIWNELSPSSVMNESTSRKKLFNESL